MNTRDSETLSQTQAQVAGRRLEKHSRQRHLMKGLEIFDTNVGWSDIELKDATEAILAKALEYAAAADFSKDDLLVVLEHYQPMPNGEKAKFMHNLQDIYQIHLKESAKHGTDIVWEP